MQRFKNFQIILQLFYGCPLYNTDITGDYMQNNEEKQIVEQARKDSGAFGALFELYYPKILKYTVFRTGNVEVARDITSETFYKAMKNLWKFRWIGTTFSAWLYRIAGNLIIDYFRNRKAEYFFIKNILEKTKKDAPADFGNVENEIIEAQEELERNKDYNEIKQYLFKLPALYQEVLVLRYIQGYKVKDICGILNKKEGTVKSLISRGIKLLKQLMQPFSTISVKECEKEMNKK